MNAILTIRERLTEKIWAQSASSDIQAAEMLYNSMLPGDAENTWCWEDVDYADQSRAAWKAMAHVSRIQKILGTYGRTRLQEDAAYRERILGALEYWLNHDYTSLNWWFNQIGLPITLGNTVLMLRPVLSEDQLARSAARVARGSMAEVPEIPERWTGANLIWGACNTVRHALLIEDGALLRQASDRAAEEITVGKKEGIQADGSFFQHGPRLYSGGYGRSYAADIAWLSHLFHGTEYQFSPEKLDIFVKHILDGLQYMTHRDSLDYNVIGRESCRRGAIKAGSLKNTVALMLQNSDMPRREELEAYYGRMNGGDAKNMTKYFPCAALLCHHTGGIYVGAKFHTDALWDAEICNNENELGYNMSYGTHTCIMHTGEEYSTINPVWDFARIPGTTARTESDEEILTHRGWTALPLPNSHSGGAQKDDCAVIYELAQHDGVEAMVTDFAFPGGFVSLGAGIRTVSEPHEALVTTVDQCTVQGEIRADGTSVIHGGVRYTALNGTKMEHTVKKQQGSWSRNSFSNPYALVEQDVLTLTVRHKACEEDAYAYMISPSSADIPDVRVLRNDTKIQAIRLPDGRILAVFHESGTLQADGRAITADAGAYFG